MGALLASICWFIWNGRNKIHFEAQARSSATVLEKATSLCLEMKEALDLKRIPQTPGTSARWHPPPLNVIKLNVDGAVNK